MYQQFFVLFAIMFSGYFLRKFDIIDYNMNRGLNRFIVYFSFPCLILEKIGTFPMDRTTMNLFYLCLLYTSDAADEEDSVDLGGRRIITKKKNKSNNNK